MKLAGKIKLIRKTRGLTQVIFAESLGIPRTHLANIEHERVTPTLMTEEVI